MSKDNRLRNLNGESIFHYSPDDKKVTEPSVLLQMASEYKRELHHLDQRGLNFENLDLSYCSLISSEFSNSQLEQSSWSFLDLQFCDFARCNLNDSTFIHCDLRSANFSAADLSNVDFIHCNLLNALLPDGLIVTDQLTIEFELGNATFFATQDTNEQSLIRVLKNDFYGSRQDFINFMFERFQEDKECTNIILDRIEFLML